MQSPHSNVRESKIVLDSTACMDCGFYAIGTWIRDSGFQSLVGFRILCGISRVPKPNKPDFSDSTRKVLFTCSGCFNDFIHVMQTGCSVAIPRISHTSGCLPFTTNSRKCGNFRQMVNDMYRSYRTKIPNQNFRNFFYKW